MLQEINSDTYARRIVGMMADYEITMFDALLWDFDSFCKRQDASAIYEDKGAVVLERMFRKYLVTNGIEDSRDQDFYTDMFMGRSNNMGLTRYEEQS